MFPFDDIIMSLHRQVSSYVLTMQEKRDLVAHKEDFKYLHIEYSVEKWYE